MVSERLKAQGKSIKCAVLTVSYGLLRPFPLTQLTPQLGDDRILVSDS